jgi:cytochrome c oxidase cbb3-type subunit 3
MTGYDDRLRGHEFDGIQEFDNRLPNWWLWTFYVACAFSVVYWVHYHVVGTGALPREAYRAQMQDAEARLTRMEVSEATLRALAAEPTALEKGREVFVTQCTQCHLANAGGSIGPNLTDRYWLHGGSPMQIYKTVVTGVPAKGMPDYWERQLGRLACQQVVAYVLSIKNSEVEGGKAPQGELESEN